MFAKPFELRMRNRITITITIAAVVVAVVVAIVAITPTETRRSTPCFQDVLFALGEGIFGRLISAWFER